MGLIGVLLVAVYTRSNVVIMSPVLFLKRPTAWLEAMSQYRGTISFAPNFAYELCLRRVKPSQIGALDLSQLARGGVRRRTDSRRHAAGVRRALRAGRLQRVELRAELRSGRALAGRHASAIRGSRSTRSTRRRLVRESVAVPIADRRSPAVRLVVLRPSVSRARHPDRRRGRASPAGPSRRPHRRARPVRDGRATSRIRRRPPTRCATAGSHTGDLGYLADG